MPRAQARSVPQFAGRESSSLHGSGTNTSTRGSFPDVRRLVSPLVPADVLTVHEPNSARGLQSSGPCGRRASSTNAIMHPPKSAPAWRATSDVREAAEAIRKRFGCAVPSWPPRVHPGSPDHGLRKTAISDKPMLGEPGFTSFTAKRSHFTRRAGNLSCKPCLASSGNAPVGMVLPSLKTIRPERT